MSNRAIRKAIQSRRAQIAEQEGKIEREQGRLEPNLGLIAHWEIEIQAFTQRMHRLEDRLAQRRQRGRSQ